MRETDCPTMNRTDDLEEVVGEYAIRPANRTAGELENPRLGGSTDSTDSIAITMSINTVGAGRGRSTQPDTNRLSTTTRRITG